MPPEPNDTLEPAPAVVEVAGPTPIPCEVQTQLAAHCWACHGETLQYTAPMKLVSVESFRAPAPSDPALTVAQAVHARIHDAQRPMPPQPLAALEPAEVAVLDAWLDNGAPSTGPQRCDEPPIVRPLTQAAAAVDSGAPLEPADATRSCAEVRAHGEGSETPYQAPFDLDQFQCFEFDAPWGDREVYGVSFKPRIDNTAIIHHMLLYQHNDTVVDRTSAPCQRTYPKSSLIAAWAPGAGDMVLPNDVGMQLPASAYTLEVHYNGSGNDRSGIEVCYTSQPRTHTAAMHWLGTTKIFGTSATGVCRPTNREPVHTLKYWPHMHLAGQHMKVTIQRGSGTTEIWHDAAFDFNDQRLWDSDKVIMPGDTITTTCSYDRPSIAGESTNQEMCYDVVLAYPVGALTQPGGTGYSIHQCVD